MSDVIKYATRDGYGNGLIKLGAKMDNLIVMDADLAAATRTGKFLEKYPDKFYNAGISEANLMGVAAGLATTGHVVFASSFAMFAAGRAFEQIRNSIAYPHLNVKIGATHAGISVGEDGASHQCNEDIALMRTIPGMVILNPADDIEAEKAVFAAAEHDGPVYLRFGRLAVPRIFDESYEYKIGESVELRAGSDVTLIATGLMVHEALKAAETLASEGIDARVINMHTIKPIDRNAVIRAASETGAIVTSEEHNIIGGLGGAVAEVVSGTVPVPVVRHGVNDEFGRSGPAQELLELFNLNAITIVKKAKEAIALKK